jgi:ribosomal protein S13
MADVEVGNKSQRSSDIAKSDNFGEDNNAKNTDDENVERIENNVQDVSGRNYTVAQNSNMTIKKEDKGCCCRCWNAIFRFFANDRIYGVGSRKSYNLKERERERRILDLISIFVVDKLTFCCL